MALDKLSLLDWFAVVHFATDDCFLFDSDPGVDLGDCVVAPVSDFPPRSAPSPTAAAAITIARTPSGTTRRGFRYHGLVGGSSEGRERSEARTTGRRPDRGRGVDPRAASRGSVLSSCEGCACVSSPAAGGMGWPHSLQYC